MVNPFTTTDANSGLPDGTLASVWQQETHCGQNLSTSSAGCKGHFQFGEGTRHDILVKYGVDAFSSDPKVAAEAAGHYLKDLKAKYHGDLPKALAAYNWGPGNVDKAIAKYGDEWLAHAPKETRDYVPQVLHRIGSDFKIPDVGNPNTPGDDDATIADRRKMMQQLGYTEEQAKNMKPADILGEAFAKILLAIVEKAFGIQMPDIPSTPATVPDATHVTPAPTPKVPTSQQVASGPAPSGRSV